MTKFDENGKVIGRCSCDASSRYEMWECVRGYCGGTFIPLTPPKDALAALEEDV
jgi:hypothetical protein